jgi:hypothetical protein
MASILQTVMLVCGPLLGIWLGNLLARSKEERQWRRDRSLEAYADVMRISDSVVTEAHRLYLELAEDRTAQLQQLSEKTSELHHAAYRAALLAPIEIAATIHALVAHIDQVATSAGSSPKVPLEEWKKLTTAERAVITTKLSNEAWHDLRGHSSEIGKWWKKILCRR